MAKAGDRFVNGDGEQIVFRKTAADTGGEMLEVEVVYQPARMGPPAHYHPFQEEHFEIQSGQMQVTIQRESRVFRAGESFTVPPGAPHTMFNNGDSEARLLWQTRPALRTEDFFEVFWGLQQDADEGQTWRPGLLQMAVILHAYRDQFRLSRPPYGLVRWVAMALAPVGRMRGYRAVYRPTT